MAERFEDLRAWQTARALSNDIYKLTSRGAFEKDWALKDQIRRAAISVMSNIAEGFESRTRPQFVDFLGVAKASAGEVRSQLYLAYDQGYLDDSKFEKLADAADKVSRQLYRLVQHVKQTDYSDRVRGHSEEYIED
jgi:four helix bundle protein